MDTSRFLAAKLRLRSFEGVEVGNVRILSAQSIDVGATAHILPGEMRRNGHCLQLALKVFPVMLSDIKRELLQRELRACSSVRHPYILPFLGTCEYGLHTILVSNRMANGNLLRYIRAEPQADRRRLILQVAEAVAFLHDDAGFVHGDLKCENVLIGPQGDALLADFGLTTAVEKAAEDKTTATDIRQQSTFRFSAPELLLGDYGVDSFGERPRSKTKSTDVWAFGMLVLQAFTGFAPWYGYTDAGVAKCITAGELPRRPESGINNLYWAICNGCWAQSPASRRSMRSISQALRVAKSLSEVLPDFAVNQLDSTIQELVFRQDPPCHEVQRTSLSPIVMHRVQYLNFILRMSACPIIAPELHQPVHIDQDAPQTLLGAGEQAPLRPGEQEELMKIYQHELVKMARKRRIAEESEREKAKECARAKAAALEKRMRKEAKQMERERAMAIALEERIRKDIDRQRTAELEEAQARLRLLKDEILALENKRSDLHTALSLTRAPRTGEPSVPRDAAASGTLPQSTDRQHATIPHAPPPSLGRSPSLTTTSPRLRSSPTQEAARCYSL